MKSLIKEQSGSVLLAITLMLPFIILIAALYTQFALTSLVTAKRDQSHTHAQLATDAGIDAAMEQINTNATWTGTTGQVELQNDGKVRTTYEVAVSEVDSTHKTLVSTGRTYRPSTDTTPEATVKVSVNLRAVTAGQYSVASGVGGLHMQNSARILGGDVLINGTITMENSAQIGLTTNPVNVSVAHHNCPISPVTSAYPRACASGENGEPVNIVGPSAHIYGTVRANNQTNSTGMTNPGLTSSSGVTAQALPEHDRNQQKANIATTTSDSYYTTCSSQTTRTWPARLKIVGDVTIGGGGSGCQITLEGDVWITGRLIIQNSGRITTSNGIVLGGSSTVNSSYPTIMVDGANGALIQNSGALMPNTSSVGPQLITYWSRAACSPDCNDVSGQDLYDTRNDTTITLQNTQAQAPNSLLYSRWSQIQISNGGTVGAVIGQTVRLSNTTSITFGVSAGVGTTHWVINDYRRAFN